MSKERKDKFIIVRVTESVKIMVNKLARKNNQNISDFVRDVLEKL
jgi:uncharacterized protein (DUF1778 family)